MRFELRRMSDYSNEAILSEINRVATIITAPKLSRTEFRKHSRVSPQTVRRRFGSWEKALVAAGIGERFDSSNRPVAPDEVITELQRVSVLLDKESFTQDEFNSCARFSDYNVYRNFGTWHKAMRLAGLNTKPLGKRYTDEECFENLLAVWTHYGRPPFHREMSLVPSQVGSKAYTRRFGTWTKALEAFIARVNSDTAAEPDLQPISGRDAEMKNRQVLASEQHGIRLGLRYSILNRDSFRCVACGRSPATHLGLVLHVDHIMPFSKGGKTVCENLRSLCQDCNLGKGSKHS
jgi:5-methylcytosine-specific restriction endonuclease McrA